MHNERLFASMVEDRNDQVAAQEAPLGRSGTQIPSFRPLSTLSD
jgi:hypothetical protein